MFCPCHNHRSSWKFAFTLKKRRKKKKMQNMLYNRRRRWMAIYGVAETVLKINRRLAPFSVFVLLFLCCWSCCCYCCCLSECPLFSFGLLFIMWSENDKYARKCLTESSTCRFFGNLFIFIFLFVLLYYDFGGEIIMPTWRSSRPVRYYVRMVYLLYTR